MNCRIIKVNPKKPEKDIIKKAADIIKKGGLVVFPTETVYGLGANALNKKAVKKIFQVKRRPLDNPLIIHLTKFEDLFNVAKKIPKEAEILAKKFWPGPLTLVLFKKKIVPNEVTAGSNTVALRVPKNKVALELIKMSGLPIAAPSANLAGKPSPTKVEHIYNDLKDKIDLILDGGKAKIGVESTVVDLTVRPPLILRPGGVTLEKLKKVLKDIKPHPFLLGEKLKDKIIKSPGMKYRHYAPKTPLILIDPVRDSKKWDKAKEEYISNGVEEKEMIKKIQNLIEKYRRQKKKIGVLASEETKKFYKEADLVLSPGPKRNLEKVAQNLFDKLREFDKKRVDIILAESFPEKGIGFAIMHRLRKAAKRSKSLKANLKRCFLL